jgi:hypothetical protein
MPEPPLTGSGAAVTDSQELAGIGLLKLAKAHLRGRMALALGALALTAVMALMGAPVARADDPVPSFTWSPAEPKTGEPVTLTSTSTIPDGVVVSEHWDFDPGGDGNGTYGNWDGPSAPVTFTTPGQHEVGLRLAVEGGAPIDLRQKVTVKIPVAFGMFPTDPVVGEQVAFFATTVPPNITSYLWDLNGDSLYETSTATTSYAYGSFAAPGSYQVGLRVAEGPNPGDPFGTAAQTLLVRATGDPGKSVQARLLSPFPVVRIAGRVGKRGARIRNLTITGPIGAKVVVRCRGRGCPFRRTTRNVVIKGKRARSSATVRVRRLERRFLRSGTRVEVSVTRTGAIGKFTRFTIRKRRPPARSDLCLVPGAPAPVACPPS